MDRTQKPEPPQSELANELHDYFPELSPDDIAKFEAHLHERNIAEERNGYRLNFVGREYARLQTGLPSELLISPDARHNAQPQNAQSGNIFITGDNLEAMRHLQNAYAGKVKMIYIDPPYNTGKEFVYSDKFEFTDEKLKAALGYSDEEIARLKSIQGKSSHSAWLTFMYPRLALAKKLLADDGVIFVSIDDNEQANLKLLMDDIFGEGNFVGNIIWERAFAPVNLKKHFSENHDYILCYSKLLNNLVCNGIQRSDECDRYKNPDNDPRGNWTSADMTVGPVIPEKLYEITTPNGKTILPTSGRCWLFTKDRFQEMLADNRIWFGENGDNVPRVKKFLSEVKQGITPMTIWKYSEVGHSQDAAQKLKELFDGKDFFDYPKSIGLIKRCLELYTDKDSLILDFFAGSGTTAHAVMQLNAEDGGNRRWMLVQVDEPTAESSEARRAGLDTIDQISRKRIQLAANKIGDTSGFKHFRLVAPQVQTLDKIEAFDPNLGGFEDMITPMGGRETLLATWLIDDGYPFNTKVEEVVFEDYTAHYVGSSQTLYLIDRGLTTPALKEILDRIGRGELAVSTIVTYPYSFEF